MVFTVRANFLLEYEDDNDDDIVVVVVVEVEGDELGIDLMVLEEEDTDERAAADLAGGAERFRFDIQKKATLQ
jgi:hypothetical protein